VVWLLNSLDGSLTHPREEDPESDGIAAALYWNHRVEAQVLLTHASAKLIHGMPQLWSGPPATRIVPVASVAYLDVL
jgi:hypothetical protein